MARPGRRAGAARPHGAHDRRRHRRRGVLGLRAARRVSRAVRHRRPAPERGPPDPAAGRRGSGRPDRRPGRGDQSARGADPSRFRLPAGDRRGDLSLVPRRADRARRPRDRRAGGPEPHQAPLLRRGGRGAADHRHGVRRDVRLGRPGRHGGVPRGRRPDRPARASGGAASGRGRGARRRGPASAAHRGVPPGRRGSRHRGRAARAGDRRACAPRSTSCCCCPRSRTASTARCSRPIGCSPTTPAGGAA